MTYRYGYEEQDLYVEQGTDRVPDDGRFYVVQSGKIVESYPSAKRALGRIEQLRMASIWGQAPDDAVNPKERAMQRAVQEGIAERFLKQSAFEKHVNRTRKGGKGR